MPVADRAAPRTRSSHCCARAIVGTEATATIANAAAYLAVSIGRDGMFVSLWLPGESASLRPTDPRFAPKDGPSFEAVALILIIALKQKLGFPTQLRSRL